MSITGHQSTLAKLKKMRESLSSNEVIKEAGEEWIREDFVPLAVDLAPRNTGYLEKHISGEVVGNQIVLKSEAPYSEEVEFGDNGPAQPFMYPAIEKTKPVLIQKIKKAVERRSK